MPGIGTGGGKFALSVGWRYAKASRSYFDSRLNHTFTDLWKPVARLAVLDVTGAYRVNRRTTVIMTLPVVTNRFSMIYPPLSPSRGRREGFDVNGLGDISIYSQSWLLDPRTHSFGNVALGAGIKTPTGNWNYMSVMPDETGLNPSRRAVYPPAVQPGDGGVGILVGYEGYKILRWPKSLHNSVTVFSSGSYLINPRNTNGTRSIISNLGVPLSPIFANRLTNSVADTYSLEWGMAWRPPYIWDKPNFKGLRLRAFGKMEGLRSHDLFGQNDGFRQPGYSISVGPGVSWTRARDTIIAEVPVVFNRHIDPGATALPGIGVRGQPAPFNPNRQMGLVAPCSLSIRYVRSF